MRIFTPGSEVPFAGHPTLGTAWAIRRELVGEPIPRLVLDLEAGRIPVDFTYRGGEADLLWMRQLPPDFGDVLDPAAAARQAGGTAPGGAWTLYTVDDGLPAPHVGAVAFGPGGEIWLDATRFQPHGAVGGSPVP